MTKELKVIEIETSKIQSDPDQPRRNFNVSRLNDLRESIKKEGIMNPLRVEQVPGKDQYIIEDGERRWRVAKELKLKTVPARVLPSRSALDRLIAQFHIQLQYESWSTLEKAYAIGRLQKMLGPRVTVKEMAEELQMPPRTLEDYAAFASLSNKSSFEKHDLNLHWARRIQVLKRYISKQAVEKLEVELSAADLDKVEKTLISMIISGRIRVDYDLVKLRDAVSRKPEIIQELITGTEKSADRIFLESDAKPALYARRTAQHAGWIVSSIQSGWPLQFWNYLAEQDVRQIKKCAQLLSRLLKELPADESK